MLKAVVPLTPEMVVAAHIRPAGPVGIIKGLEPVNTTDPVTSSIVENNWVVFLDYLRKEGQDVNKPNMRILPRLCRIFFDHLLSANPNQEEIQFGYSAAGMKSMKFPTTTEGRKTYNTKQEFIADMLVLGSCGTENLLVFCLHYLGYSITIHDTDPLNTSTRTVDHPFPIRELSIQNQHSVYWSPLNTSVPADGDCMFNSVAHLLKDDLAKHDALLSQGKSIFPQIDSLYQSLMSLPLETLFNFYTIILPNSTQEWRRFFYETKRRANQSKNTNIFYVLENLFNGKPVNLSPNLILSCKALLAKNIISHIKSAKELGESEAPTERTLIYPFENVNNIEPTTFLYTIVEFLNELLKSLKNHYKNNFNLEKCYTDRFLNQLILLLHPTFPINNMGFNSDSVVIDILKQFQISDTKFESINEEELRKFRKDDIEQAIKTLQNVFINHIYVTHKSFRPTIENHLLYRKLKANFIQKTLLNDNVDSLFALYKTIVPNSKIAALALFKNDTSNKHHKNIPFGQGEQAIITLSNLNNKREEMNKHPDLIKHAKEKLVDIIMNSYTNDPGTHKIIDDYIAGNSTSTLTLQARDEAPPIALVNTKSIPR